MSVNSAVRYMPPEMIVAECGAERGYAASGGAGAEALIEDPWEDL